MELKIKNVRSPDYFGKERKISKHTRKLNGEVFESPRVVLPPEFNHLIGKSYRLYEADVELEEEFWSFKMIIKGKAILLIIPESEEKQEKEWDDEEWDREWEE